MVRLKPQRRKLYTQLREEHLTHREALEFSRLKKHVPPGGGKKQYPPVLTELVKDRRVMWGKFDKEAQDRGWGKTKRVTEWHKRVGELYDGLSKKYTGNFFVQKDVHGKKIPQRINPWALYDARLGVLPQEDQWDTPRSNRKNPVTGVTFKVEKRYKAKQLRDDIAYYKQKIKETGDPNEEWHWRLKGAEYDLKHGEY